MIVGENEIKIINYLAVASEAYTHILIKKKK